MNHRTSSPHYGAWIPDSDISDLSDDGIHMLKRQLIELEKGHSMETIRENIKNRKLFGNQFSSYDPYKEHNTAILENLRN